MIAVTLYALIKVPEHADERAILLALAEHRRLWRPRQHAGDPRRRREAEQKIEELDDVEQTLLNPTLRRAYDNSLAIARGGGGRLGGSIRPYVTLEHLWVGDPVRMGAARTMLGVVQGSAIRMSAVESMLHGHPDIAGALGVNVRAGVGVRQQLQARAEALGLKWKLEARQ